MYAAVLVEQCSISMCSSSVHFTHVSNCWTGIWGGTVGWKMGWNGGCVANSCK